MSRISEIWQQHEQRQGKVTGLLFTRFSADLKAPIYLGYLVAERKRCLLLPVNINELQSHHIEKELKGLKLEIRADNRSPDSAFLTLTLLNSAATDIFDILVQDVINKVSVEEEHKIILKKFLQRIEAWRLLFDKLESNSLTREQQQGLYGELHFLRKWLLWHDNYCHCIISWLGADNVQRDFQVGPFGVEIKTTVARNHQKLQISSERQLDESTLETLWLGHISLEVQQKNGETLNQIVYAIESLIKNDVIALTTFREKLLRVGYLKAHQIVYEEYGYQIRAENFFIVKNDFPRITESMVPQGVGDVKYSIVLSGLDQYSCNESNIFELISHARTF